MSRNSEWLDSTFTSKSKAERLLTPELENGTLSLHDYDLAISFLPGYHRYWPVACAFTTTSAAAAYGRFKRPPWTVARTSIVTGLLGFVGLIYGEFRSARAHLVFTQSLDNPEGFMQALENVNTRTGGVRPLGFTMPNARRGIVNTNTNDTEPSGIDVVRDGDWEIQSQSQDRERRTTMANSQTSSEASLLRWEQIRAANTRIAGQNSSWDALRQKHERSIIPSSQATTGKVRGVTDNDRVSEQARFDAMVEAERKNNQS